MLREIRTTQLMDKQGLVNSDDRGIEQTIGVYFEC